MFASNLISLHNFIADLFFSSAMQLKTNSIIFVDYIWFWGGEGDEVSNEKWVQTSIMLCAIGRKWKHVHLAVMPKKNCMRHSHEFNKHNHNVNLLAAISGFSNFAPISKR